MTNVYLTIKALHIISFTAWMAGMFYLPRIFVYHSEKKLDINTYKNSLEPWVLIKIFFVILMSACHGFFIKCYKSFYNKKNKYNDKFFRIINEVPTIFLVVIVFLAVFKPSF